MEQVLLSCIPCTVMLCVVMAAVVFSNRSSQNRKLKVLVPGEVGFVAEMYYYDSAIQKGGSLEDVIEHHEDYELRKTEVEKWDAGIVKDMNDAIENRSREGVMDCLVQLVIDLESLKHLYSDTRELAVSTLLKVTAKVGIKYVTGIDDQIIKQELLKILTTQGCDQDPNRAQVPDRDQIRHIVDTSFAIPFWPALRTIIRDALARLL